MTPAQCIAARRLLDWSARELGRRCKVTAPTVLAFERGEKNTIPSITAGFEREFKLAGVRFVPSAEQRPDAQIQSIVLDDGSRVELG